MNIATNLQIKNYTIDNNNIIIPILNTSKENKYEINVDVGTVTINDILYNFTLESTHISINNMIYHFNGYLFNISNNLARVRGETISLDKFHLNISKGRILIKNKYYNFILKNNIILIGSKLNYNDDDLLIIQNNNQCLYESVKNIMNLNQSIKNKILPCDKSQKTLKDINNNLIKNNSNLSKCFDSLLNINLIINNLNNKFKKDIDIYLYYNEYNQDLYNTDKELYKYIKQSTKINKDISFWFFHLNLFINSIAEKDFNILILNQLMTSRCYLQNLKLTFNKIKQFTDCFKQNRIDILINNFDKLIIFDNDLNCIKQNFIQNKQLLDNYNEIFKKYESLLKLLNSKVEIIEFFINPSVLQPKQFINLQHIARDSQNTHDTNILNNLFNIIIKLQKQTHITKTINVSINEIIEYFNSKKKNIKLNFFNYIYHYLFTSNYNKIIIHNTKIDNTIKVINHIKNNNGYIDRFKMTELQVLQLVWNAIGNNNDLKDILYFNLSDITTYRGLVCLTGRVTRMIDVFNGIDDAIKPNALDFRKEMMNKCVKIRNELEANDILDENNFYKNEIKKQLYNDYVTSKILTNEDFEREINEWIEYI